MKTKNLPLIRATAFASLVAISLAFSAAPPAWAKKHKSVAQLTDPNYLAALTVANRFLSAWQSNDQAAAMPLITNHAKQQTTEEGIDKLFSGSEMRGFEIAHGRVLRQGRYSFPIVLLQANDSGDTHRRFGDLVITVTGTNDWAVDKLP